MTRCAHIILVAVALLVLLSGACTGGTPGSNADPGATLAVEKVKREVHNSVKEAEEFIDRGYINNGFARLSEAEKMIDAVPGGESKIDRQDLYCLNAYKGRIFLAYRDFRNAAKYYGRCLKYAPTRFDSLQMTLDYCVISCHNGDSAAAVKAEAYLGTIEIEDTLYKAYTRDIARGYIQKYFGDRETSRDHFAESLRISQTKGFNGHSRLTPLSEMYEYYAAKGNLDSMLFYLDDYKKLADAYKTPEMMADVNKGYLKSYIMAGEREKALEAFDGYFSIMDSLYNPSGFSALNSRYNDENMTRTADKMMRLEVKVSRLKLIIVLIAAGLILGVGVWLVSRSLIQSRKRIFFLNREIALKEAPEREAEQAAPTSDDSRHAELMRAINEALADPDVYCDPDFCIATLAKLVDSNSKYVSQAINESTGMNFRTFINSLRIKIARARLTESEEYSNLTIQSISESVGFKSTSNFVIAFKKVMGITPSAYQKLARRDSPFE